MKYQWHVFLRVFGLVFSTILLGCSLDVQLSPTTSLVPYEFKGVLDSSYAPDEKLSGQIAYNLNAQEEPLAAFEDGNGKILVVSRSGDSLSFSKFNKDGSLVTGFGSGGVVVPAIERLRNSLYPGARYIFALDSMGRILFASNSSGLGPLDVTNLNLYRFLSTGALDRSFADQGKASIEYDGQVLPRKIYVDSSERIWVVGSRIVDTSTSSTRAMVWRFNDDGDLDTSLAGSGELVLGGTVSGGVTSGFSGGYDLAFSDGGTRALIAGYRGTAAGMSANDQAQLWKIELNGNLDATFGTNGISILSGSESHARSILVLADGSILVAGHTGTSSSGDFIVWKRTSAGAADTTFGASGSRTTASLGANFYETPDAMWIDASNNIYVSGIGRNYGTSVKKGLLWRLTSGGAFDATFGTAGIFSWDGAFNLNYLYSSSTVADASAIYVIDYAELSYDDATTTLPRSEAWMKKLNLNGSWDASFNTTGTKVFDFRVLTPLPGLIQKTSIDKEGRIYVMQTVSALEDGNIAYISRFKTTGSLDTSFADQGHLAIQDVVYGSFDIDSQGRVVVVGAVYDTGAVSRLIVRRYLSSGSADSSFTGSNNVDFDTYQPRMYLATKSSEITKGIDVKADGSGSIYVGLYIAEIISNVEYPRVAIARLNSSGVLDTTYGTDGKFISVQLDGMVNQSYLPFSLFVDSKGRAVVAGVFPLRPFTSALPPITLLRLTTAGVLDSTYGTNGEWNSSILDPNFMALMGTTSFQMDSKDRVVMPILILTSPTSLGTYITRINDNGVLDTSFNSVGGLELPTTLFPGKSPTYSDISFDENNNIRFFTYLMNPNLTVPVTDLQVGYAQITEAGAIKGTGAINTLSTEYYVAEAVRVHSWSEGAVVLLPGVKGADSRQQRNIVVKFE
ncbi:delta-60 repeat domain-containing protein [Bdellovibrio bacteriovorus]|uniref:delta-60 repeat domain-containing protein n=1 Tax=Bdellovibrio bacteriovorus TaxID=959 RepID=UPI0035A5B947